MDESTRMVLNLLKGWAKKTLVELGSALVKAVSDTVDLLLGFTIAPEYEADVVIYDKEFNVKILCWRVDGKLRCVENQ